MIWTSLKNKFELFKFYIGTLMHSGDKAILQDGGDASLSDKTNVEQTVQQKSVYKDLLNAQVTDEVKELRHEMYYSERKSKAYKYAGGGYAKKKNNFGGYRGKIERSDGFDVQVLQPNVVDSGPLDISEEGVIKATATGREFDYTIKIERDFIPRFRLEQYATKVVVKRINETKAMLDVYITQYESQFNRNHRPFLNEVKRIYDGDMRSEITDFNTLSFTSFNAFGTDDLKFFKYNNIEFDGIVMFDGDYVLKFLADIIEDGTDLISEFYDEKTAEKSAKHEMREGATLDMTNLIKPDEDEKNEEALELIKNTEGIELMKNGES